MRVFGIILTILIVIIMGWGIARLVTGKPNKPAATTQTTKQVKFADKATEVRLTIDGAVVGLENHQLIRITINPSSRTVEVLKGYNGEVVRTQNLSNDQAAFTRFLIALNTYGYTRENTQASKDERGVCPLGLRYIYEASYTSGPSLRSWSSSCGGKNERFLGIVSSVQQLFRNQIPNYSKFVSGVSLTR